MSVTAVERGSPGEDEAPLKVRDSKFGVIVTAGAQEGAPEVSETAKEVKEEDKEVPHIKIESVEEELDATREVIVRTNVKVKEEKGENTKIVEDNVNTFEQLAEFDNFLEELLNNDEDMQEADNSLVKDTISIIKKENINEDSDENVKVPVIIIRKSVSGNVGEFISTSKFDEEQGADEKEELIYSDDELSLHSDCISLEADSDFTEVAGTVEETENKIAKMKSLKKPEENQPEREKLPEEVLTQLRVEGRRRRKRLAKQRKREREMLERKKQSGNINVKGPSAEVSKIYSSLHNQLEGNETNYGDGGDAWKSEMDAKDLELYVVSRIKKKKIETCHKNEIRKKRPKEREDKAHINSSSLHLKNINVRGQSSDGLSKSLHERLSPYTPTSTAEWGTNERTTSSQLSPTSMNFKRGRSDLCRSPSPTRFKKGRSSHSPQSYSTKMHERIIVVFNCKNLVPERAIRLLTIQNRMMEIEKWEFLGMHSNRRCSVHFVIPPEDIDKLKSNNWKLCYELSMVVVLRAVDLKGFKPDQVQFINPDRRTFIRLRRAFRKRIKKKVDLRLEEVWRAVAQLRESTLFSLSAGGNLTSPHPDEKCMNWSGIQSSPGAAGVGCIDSLLTKS